MSWDQEIKSTLAWAGDEVFIGRFVIFTNPARVFIGSRTRIDPFVLITTALRTGNNVQICRGATLGGGSQQHIEMGSWSFVGYNSSLFTSSEDYSGDQGPVNEYWGDNKIFRGDIKFNDHSGVASDVIVMPGVELPTGCLIAAGSFVYDNKRLEPWSVMVGGRDRNNPLHVMKRRNKDKVLEAANNPEFLKRR